MLTAPGELGSGDVVGEEVAVVDVVETVVEGDGGGGGDATY